MQRRGCSDASPVQRELPEVRGGRVQAGCGNTATIQCVRGLQVVDGRGFEVRRDATFGMVENGVQTSFKKEFEKVVSVVGDSPSRGMFIDSCFDHCQIESQETWFKSDSPHLANTSIAKAVGYWFYGRGPFNEVDCNYPCNPTCQNLVSDPKDHPGI
ncbi:Pectinacetylesterase/NOTUM [Vigna unguiculata]|uniref:Pectin acetylesterase n=1 Tax=Vigna unguiculata TaxID=3917 RepID=A0A4D6M736_VIGUN|nr:Pectinacetylesterase/NOTUM [Vigna unguiculata]